MGQQKVREKEAYLIRNLSLVTFYEKREREQEEERNGYGVQRAMLEQRRAEEERMDVRVVERR